MSHHHHPMDEFTVTDIRHTLGEAWRIVRDRRWLFLMPFLGASIVAMFMSLWIPRQYTVSTILRREHDPVIANLVGRNWTEPYAEIRQRMTGELNDPTIIEDALARLDLPRGAECFPNGELTPAGVAARKMLAAQVAKGITTKSIENSKHRDVVSIRLTLNDGRIVQDVLRSLRDDYVARSQQRTTEVLRGVDAFLQKESSRCHSDLSELQKRVVEMESLYPGINPELTDPTQAEQAALAVENMHYTRRIEDLRHQRQELSSRHQAALANPASAVAQTAILMEPPNPQYVQLQQDIERIDREIFDARTIKMMTDLHPTMQALRQSLEAKRTALERTSPVMEIDSKPSEPILTPAQHMEKELADLDAKITDAEARTASNQGRILKIELARAQVIEHRDEYFRLKEKAARINDELVTWNKSLSPIKHLMAVENSHRGIHFTVMSDVEDEVRPSSPDPRAVVGICLAIGVAVGALVVLLAELFDRSFRTAHAISSTLGVPVIESVDEIVTQAARRRRMLRRMVVMPVTTAILFAALMLSGAMAYFSIESPPKYEILKRSPHAVVMGFEE